MNILNKMYEFTGNPLSPIGLGLLGVVASQYSFRHDGVWPVTLISLLCFIIALISSIRQYTKSWFRLAMISFLAIGVLSSGIDLARLSHDSHSNRASQDYDSTQSEYSGDATNAHTNSPQGADANMMTAEINGVMTELWLEKTSVSNGRMFVTFCSYNPRGEKDATITMNFDKNIAPGYYKITDKDKMFELKANVNHLGKSRLISENRGEKKNTLSTLV